MRVATAAAWTLLLGWNLPAYSEKPRVGPYQLLGAIKVDTAASFSGLSMAPSGNAVLVQYQDRCDVVAPKGTWHGLFTTKVELSYCRWATGDVLKGRSKGGGVAFEHAHIFPQPGTDGRPIEPVRFEDEKGETVREDWLMTGREKLFVVERGERVEVTTAEARIVQRYRFDRISRRVLVDSGAVAIIYDLDARSHQIIPVVVVEQDAYIERHLYMVPGEPLLVVHEAQLDDRGHMYVDHRLKLLDLKGTELAEFPLRVTDGGSHVEPARIVVSRDLLAFLVWTEDGPSLKVYARRPK